MTVSDLARELSDRYHKVVRPRDITNLFYDRCLDDACCPVLGGRRLIPQDYIPVIVGVLRGRGLIGDDPGGRP
jgi:hypothetical protein